MHRLYSTYARATWNLPGVSAFPMSINATANSPTQARSAYRKGMLLNIWAIKVELCIQQFKKKKNNCKNKKYERQEVFPDRQTNNKIERFSIKMSL